jgi:hypothetical protein
LDKHPDRRDSSVETIARQLVRVMRNWSSDEAPYLLEVPYAGEGIPHFVVGRMIRGSFPRDWTTEYLDLQLELRKRPWPEEIPFDPEERLAEIISDLIFYLKGGEVRHIEG